METNSLLETLLWEPIKHAAIVGIQFTKMFYSWISLLLMTLISIEETPLVKGLSVRSHTERVYVHQEYLFKGVFKIGISSAKYKCLSKQEIYCWLKSSVKTILMLIIVEQYLQTHVVDSRLIFLCKTCSTQIVDLWKHSVNSSITFWLI